MLLEIKVDYFCLVFEIFIDIVDDFFLFFEWDKFCGFGCYY